MSVSRRSFLAASAAPALFASQAPQRTFGPNDQIQIALIGAGGMGMGDVQYALRIPGNKIVAACDVYDGRLERARELWGKDLFVTRDYREILNRPDVDAVIIATPDHWHARIAIDALKAGKDVYLEKPMIQKIEQGWPLLDAARSSNRILQVGSQYVSSVIYQKVNELIRQGAIGTLTMVEAVLDRNTALGAWQYSIPPDASPDTIDWDRFLGDAPKRPFEPIRLFRWRNYQDYGTGVAGDLFVHLLSGLHVSTGAIGPTRAYATGGLRYWNDGRDVPDVMLALYDYEATPSHPAFNLALRVNFKSSVPNEVFGFRFVGTEGIIQAGDRVTLSRPPKEAEPGYTIGTFTAATQEKFLAEYRKKYPPRDASSSTMDASSEEVFSPPRNYSAHLEHHKVFFAAVRSRRPVVEDALFGFRTAGGALLANLSYFQKRIVAWDPQNLKLIS